MSESSSPSVIIGIDPSLTATGLVAMDANGKLLSCQTIRTTTTMVLPARLHRLGVDTRTFIHQYRQRLRMIVVEFPLFPARRLNWRAVSALWQAVGVVLAVSAEYMTQASILCVIPARGYARPATKVRVKGLTEHEADAYHFVRYVQSAWRVIEKAAGKDWKFIIVKFSRGGVMVAKTKGEEKCT